MKPEAELLGAAAARATEGADDAVTRFGRRAVEAGLVDVAFSEIESPVGTLVVGVTPRGLVAVEFEDDRLEQLLARFARELSPRVLRSPSATEAARRELGEYFEGRRRSFDLRLDRRLMGSFAKDVLTATARVPYGGVATYGEIAKRIGHPGSARAVGAALGSNPIAIVVPCHRVVGAGGKLTGYAGGLQRKEYLLRLEGGLPF
ncbi:MAG TPA: methylated-DNA--[protein]-cysteine S-methyltransferase [Actinomycetota bacterium]|jgi:methylated-DNA-[protein]-cysteine S-methyltransferase